MAQKKKTIPPPRKPRPTDIKKPETQPTSKVTETVRPAATRKPVQTQKPEFVFGRINYILMLGGIGLILLGFLLMTGGGSKDPAVFNPEIFSPVRITLAPILILLGYVVEIVAIMIKPGAATEA